IALAALLAWRLHAARAEPRALRRAALGGLLLILLQAVVGGVGVWLQLPIYTSVAHATLAQLTLATFAVLAYALSPRWAATVPAPHPSARAGRKLAVAGVVLLIAQTVLGAVARHGTDSTILWTHVGNAFAVFLLLLIVAGFSAGRFAQVPGVRGLGGAML